jgi:hypothetical protein
MNEQTSGKRGVTTAQYIGGMDSSISLMLLIVSGFLGAVMVGIVLAIVQGGSRMRDHSAGPLFFFGLLVAGSSLMGMRLAIRGPKPLSNFSLTMAILHGPFVVLGVVMPLAVGVSWM